MGTVWKPKPASILKRWSPGIIEFAGFRQISRMKCLPLSNFTVTKN